MFGFCTLPQLSKTLNTPVYRLDYICRTRSISFTRIGNVRLYGPESQEQIKRELSRMHPEPEPASAINPFVPRQLQAV